MAMYYQSSSEVQADGLQTLYLMNPNYVGYSDTQPNMLYMSSATSSAAVHALNSALLPHAPLPHPHHFVGIPLAHDSTRPPPVLSQQQDIPAAQNPISAAAAARHHYNTWGLVDQAASGNEQNQPDDMPQQTPRGLSLSLSAHHQTKVSGDRDHFPAGQIISPKNCSSPTESINGVNTMQSVIMGSKFLKAAQELLDELVNVGVGNSDAKTHRPNKAEVIKDSMATKSGGGGGAAAELTAAQRQEIQMKKGKLNSMLDEVEQRCRQYNQQMQIIVASFEQAAGIGSAKAYTQLALKTILKQFRCLKSTISAQIKGLNKSLGEEESSDNKFEGSRLKFVDHQLRQQRALQQLGMMQNSAWRPQRGLPERAVSVLRAWLFEHFLHPYPKDADKQMLAKQTGLTRSQVSNWFINARVRLWKPMVEEMYIEETKNNQNQIPIDGDASIKQEPDNKTPRTTGPPPPPPEISAAAPLPARTNFAQLISSLNMENLQEKSPKKPRNASSLSADQMEMKGGDDHQATAIKRFSNNVKFSTENYLSMPAAANVNRYGADQQLAAGGFGQGNSFSLSLALPPTDQSQHNFLSHRNFELVEGGGIDEGGAAAASHPSIGYEILDFQSRKPFPAQLLPDFVA